MYRVKTQTIQSILLNILSLINLLLKFESNCSKFLFFYKKKGLAPPLLKKKYK